MYFLQSNVNKVLLLATSQASIQHLIDFVLTNEQEATEISNYHDDILVIEAGKIVGKYKILDLIELLFTEVDFPRLLISKLMNNIGEGCELESDVVTALKNLPFIDKNNKIIKILALENIIEQLINQLEATEDKLILEKQYTSYLKISLNEIKENLETSVKPHIEELISNNKKLQRGICDRIATEAQLLQTTSELQEIFQAFPDVYIRVDTKGEILSYHGKINSCFLIETDAYLGKNFKEILPLDVADNFQEKIHQTYTKNLSNTLEYSIILFQSVQYFEARFFVSIPNQVIIIIRDITEQKQSQIYLQNAKEELENRVKARTHELKSSLKEKEILLKEIHHRVKNNLQIISSLLRLQTGYVQDKQSLGIFQDSQSRIRAMAMIHDNLYQSDDLERINFDNYIRNLTTYISRSYGIKKDIKITLDIGNIFLRIDTAIPCGLIINELVSNSIKHAFVEQIQGNIHIEFDKIGDHKYSLTVSDNGTGISDNSEMLLSQSMGLQLVWNLVEQLEGSITFNNKLGTLFTIIFVEHN